MRLDRLAARIRPRTWWEGIDLGFALGRHWFVPLWGLWVLSALPLGGAAAVWFYERPYLWILLLWWLKPVYEAPLLFWLSRALFGAPPGLRGLWRERRKVLPLGLLPSLLWRRLHPSRSFQLPLIQLEGLRGRERKQRWRVIQGNSGTGAWLTLICLNLESILWSSALILVLFLVPDELPRLDPEAALFEVESAAYWVSAVLYWLAMSVMAPFYVAAGFALYLTRRTELEAWDLELVFRRAAAEEGGRGRRPGRIAATVALLVVAFSTAPVLDADVQDLDPEEARALIAEVLAEEDFGKTTEVRTWVYVGKSNEEPPEGDLPDWLRNLLDLLAAGANPAAVLVKWALVLLVALACILVLRRILMELPRLGPEPAAVPQPDQAPQALGRVGAAELPADVEGQVRALIKAGDLRSALALLYQASLARLQQGYGLEIPVGATERECLTLVARARSDLETALLRQLTGIWQRMAYAHRSPSDQELAALLRDWRRWWGKRDEV